MMGTGHACSGLFFGAAALPLAPVHHWAWQVAWCAAWGGAAYLPDLDQRGSTAARAWGPATNGLARLVSTIACGHRNGTHSVLGLAVIGVVAWALTLHPVGQVALLALMIGLAAQSLHFVIPGRVEETVIGNLILSWGGAWALIAHGPGSPSWLPAAVLAGSIVHVLGDMLTVGGCPLGWPFSQRNFGLALFKAGAKVETALVTPLFGLGAAVLLYVNTGVGDALAPIVNALGGNS